MQFPVGSVVASDTKAYIKKSRGTRPYDYEEYWISAEAYAVPWYRDDFVNQLVGTGEFKVLRLGTDNG